MVVSEIRVHDSEELTTSYCAHVCFHLHLFAGWYTVVVIHI